MDAWFLAVGLRKLKEEAVWPDAWWGVSDRASAGGASAGAGGWAGGKAWGSRPQAAASSWLSLAHALGHAARPSSASARVDAEAQQQGCDASRRHSPEGVSGALPGSSPRATRTNEPVPEPGPPRYSHRNQDPTYIYIKFLLSLDSHYTSHKKTSKQVHFW